MGVFPRYSARRWLTAMLPFLLLIPVYCTGAALQEGMGFGALNSGLRKVAFSNEPSWVPRGERHRSTMHMPDPPAIVFTRAPATVRAAHAMLTGPAAPIALGAANAGAHAGSAGPEIYLPSTSEAPVEDGRTRDGSRNLVEMRLGPFASRTARAFIRNGELLVQVEAFSDLLELPYGDSVGRFTLVLPGGKGTLVLDSATGTATAPNGITQHALTIADHKHYVPLPVLASALGVEARFDPEQQLVMVLPSADLPAVRRIRREKARQHVADDAAEIQPSFEPAALASKGWTGLTMDYDATASSLESNKLTSFDLDIASGLLGGTASVGVRGTGQASNTQFDGSWTHIWGEGRWVRQLRLGDGAGTGPRPALSRGFLLTNAPPYRPLVVEALPFAGTLEPGWSVEAYRSGQLVAFDSTGSGGRYQITLPIHYGENPVDFVAYGPLGEVRTFNRTFRALPNMLPSGSAEYALSGGACRYECDGRANGDLRLGLSRRVTARAGLDYEGRKEGQFWTPYFGIVSNPLNAFGVELESVRRGFDRGTVRFEPNAGIRTVFDYVNYSDDAAERRLGAPGRQDEIRVSGRFARRRDGSGMALETAASRYNDETGYRNDARVGISTQQGNTLIRPYLRVEDSKYNGIGARRTFGGGELTLLPRPSLGNLFGRMWLRAEGEVGSNGKPELASLTVMRSLITRVRLEGGYRWQRSTKGSTLWLGIVSELSAVRYSARAMSVVGGDNDRVEQSLGGSVVWDKYGDRFLFSAEPATDRTGVVGTVYLDANGDGLRQVDEPTLAGVRVLTPGQAMITDSLGRFQLWGLQAFEPVRFSVDTASLPDPHYIPRKAGVVVTPELGQLAVIEMPVDVGAILEGRLELSADAPPLAGSLRLILTEKSSGNIRTVETFQDGSFYIMGVRPGRYKLSVDPEMLRVAGLASDPIDVDVPLVPTKGRKVLRPRIRSLIVALRPADVKLELASQSTSPDER